MQRRHLLASLAATPFLASAQQPALVKPKVLQPGDRVAIISPSTETLEPERLQIAEETCEYFGLKPTRMPNCGKRQVNYAESVKNRVSDLHAAFSNPEFKAVFCIRGGYGAPQILDSLDYALIRRNPKVFLGYSDITALHLAIYKRSGLLTFHGPIPLSAFTGYTQENFKRALFSREPLGELGNPKESNLLRPNHRLRTIVGGKASGTLVGGNLSLIVALMGTPYELDTKGKILFLEDVGEQVYSLDRMLTNQRLAKKLQQSAGLIWGECADCPPDGKFNPTSTYGYSETIQNLLGDLGIPVLSGLTIGHTSDQLTLPMGAKATLDADRKVLIVEESAFA
jgi:muramoyltetrapeptide carboxypeptidase